MRPLLTTIAFVLATAACGGGSPAAEGGSHTAAVAASGSGVSVDVIATSTWQGGFNGAVRITDTSFANPISSFVVVFKMSSGAVTGTPWNGAITGPDSSGNYTATSLSWMANQPIKAGQTWDVGFNGSGTLGTTTIVSLTLNGSAVSIGGGTDNPPTVSLASSATTVTTASTITLTATATDDHGVAKVVFSNGGAQLCSVTTAPYTCAVPLTSVNNGANTFTATAYDTANQTAAATAAVTVNIPTSTDNPPTVSLASSATTVTTASTITLTATATDDHGVSKVVFSNGATQLCSVTAAPYTCAVPLTSANNGTVTFTATAYDTANQTAAATAAVTVNIPTSTDNPPTVSLASSATTVTTASTITLTATATDDHGVAKVEFYEGATLLGSKTAAPYTQTVTYAQANNGTHTYTAKAYDTANQVTTSTAVTVTVNIGTTSTAVSVNAGGAAVGSFLADQYFSGGSVATNTATNDISQITTNPPPASIFQSERYGAFTYTIPGLGAGKAVSVTLYFSENYVSAAGQRLFSVAINGTTVLSSFDIYASAGGRNKGIARTFSATANTSGQVAIQFISGTQNPKVSGISVAPSGTTDNPPTISLASSATTVTTASTITLTATASDDHGVSKVVFSNGATQLCSVTASPYTCAVPLTSANNGTVTFSATATDTANQTATATAAVTVNIPTSTDNPPTVSLASSATSVTTASTITLTATATDDHGVTKVEFYDGTTLLGTDTTAPYTQAVNVTSASNGTHSLTAKAYDTAGQSTTSAAVSLVVNIGGSTSSYQIDPPDACYNQYWVKGCETGTCGGRCQVANACSPPEDPSKSALPMTFVCPRFMEYSDEMTQAAIDDWGPNPPFVYGVVGHDADTGGLDVGTSSCCQCYQLVFETPEQGSPQPPNLPYPKPMIVQSFNTAAGGGKNFDVFMGAGGFGAFNACVPGSYSGTQTTTFGHFMYSAFPSDYPGQGGIKALNISECKVNGGVTAASLQSSTCQAKIASLCNTAAASSTTVANETKNSCIQTNAFTGFYHQNWIVRAKRVECPANLTRVTGCKLASQGLPTANPNAVSPATADSTFKTGYTTTTMQDCCKPSCAWQDQVGGAGNTTVGSWTSFYSCDQNGVPITAPAAQ